MSLDLIGIQNVGEFYSHHYLDALLENDLKGLFAQWREEDEHTPDKRLNRLAAAFFQAKQRALRANNQSARYQHSHSLHVDLLEALGYRYDFGVRYLLDGSAIPALAAALRDGREYLWIVETPFVDEDSSPLEQFIQSEQYPPAFQDDEELKLPEDTWTWEDLIGEIYRIDSAPRWVILLAGSLVFLCERSKWGTGQYLLFDLDEIFGRRLTATLRAAAALLACEALAPDDGIPLHDTLDENSHKHAYGVSKDLKYGVRSAVELLANEYVWYQREVAKGALFQDADLARKLTSECLRYLYRLLFLFYAEARGGELNVAPMKSEAYRTGYSLEMLRDLEQVPLNTPQAQNGYFLHDSLEKVFHLINQGYGKTAEQLTLESAGEVYQEYGFQIDGLHNPLFDPKSTPLLSATKFRNIILQEVIQLLSLSKESRRNRNGRGRISYAQLGINQLGAVYEGLLSFSGFFAQEELFEVKSARDEHVTPDTQTYFIPIHERDRYEADEFVYEEMPDGTRQRRRIPKGTFVFRMAGRDREKSASYYTTEVLTQCVVKYSLKELLKDKSADQILNLTICEPAMGSGAFINEAINQLADAYLERKQQELELRIPPDQYRRERQKVKYHLAVNNAYGVDLNPTAVELAQVSIWLNILYEGAPAPWFNPHLAVGNSLIGARREVYSAEDVLSGAYKSKALDKVPLGDGSGGFLKRPVGTVYHWLLPDEGMAAFDKDKVIKELAPEEVQAIKDWRKDFTKKITKEELKILQSLWGAAEKLWEMHLRRRLGVRERTRQHIPLWGQPENQSSNQSAELSIQQRQRELAYLERPTSPYRRLKLAMDYWCALWFWPLQEAKQLPSRTQYLNEISEIFKQAAEEFKRLPEQLNLFEQVQQPKQAAFADLPVPNVDELCSGNNRLRFTKEISKKITFHHWELVFANIFSSSLGFDLILGNPPWVKVKWSETGILAEFDPILSVRSYSASAVGKEREDLLNSLERKQLYLQEFLANQGEHSFLGNQANYSPLEGIQLNSYKCFIVRGWEIGNTHTVIGLLYPEGIYEDSNGGHFRSVLYPRLCFHFMFQNQLMLFSDIGHRVRYGVNIYRAVQKNEISFDHIVNLYHPNTVDLCYSNDGFGEIPGIKNDDNHWDLRGHRNRIIKLDTNKLTTLRNVFESSETPIEETRLAIIHSEEILSVLENFSKQKINLGNSNIDYYSTRMWDETGAQENGLIKKSCSIPDDPSEWIISGPHIHVSNPLYQTPNEGCRSKGDYSEIDLTSIPLDYMPRTVYGRACNKERFENNVPDWKEKKITSYYRYLSRGMLSQAGERTLIPVIIPPNVKHINTMFSICFVDKKYLLRFTGLSSSIPYDFFIKVLGKGFFERSTASLLPIPDFSILSSWMINRVLRLNCVTNQYTDLWEELNRIDINKDNWANNDNRLSIWSILEKKWSRKSALRNSFERRQALIEIDVLASMELGLTLKELITIYRVQFPVLQNYERKYLFDQRGMEVPIKTVHGELVVNEDHEKFPEMVPPFTPVDREADYRQAWAFFEERLKEEEEK